MLKSLLQLLLVAATAYAGYLSLLYLQQRQMMFPGAGMSAEPLAALHLAPPRQRVSLRASFGRVQAVWIPAPEATAPALIYFHGNAEFAAQNLDALSRVAALGVQVLLIEYPGYAGSDGQPTRSSLNEAAQLGFDWLAAHPRVDRQRIIGMGRSIGSGPAVELSSTRPLAGLVLLSPFAQLDGFAHQVGAPAGLIRDRYDNLAQLRSFAGPVLLFHGRHDFIIPIRHSQTLHQASPSSRLIELDCGHNDCPYFGAAFLEVLQRYLHTEFAAERPAKPQAPGDVSASQH